MKTLTIASFKGGVGKSILSILTANSLAAAGKKVCVIDLDINNSTSFTYLTEPDETGRRNIAVALQSPDLSDHVRPTNVPGIDIIESSLYLTDFQTIPINRLSQKIHTLDHYDYVVIDTPPAYNNLVLAAMDVADVIVTPVILSQYDFNTAQFLSRKIQSETSYYPKWFLTINGYNRSFERYQKSSQTEYVELFTTHFENLLPKECFLPWTSQVRRYIDRDEKIKNTDKYAKLRSSIISFVSIITGEDIVIEGEF